MSTKKDILTLWDSIKGCTLCPTKHEKVFIRGEVIQPDILFIGSNPDEEEYKNKQIFVGEIRSIFNDLLHESGLRELKLLYSPSVFCWTDKDVDPPACAPENCRQYVQSLINISKPKNVVFLGKKATNYVFPLIKFNFARKFSSDEFEGIKFFCSYHPAYVLRQPSRYETVLSGLLSIKNNLSLG